MKLLTVGKGNRKLAKSDLNSKYLSAGVALLPFNFSGHNICPCATPSCASVCLNWAGMGQMTCVQRARLLKTQLLFKDQKRFVNQLYKEIQSFINKAVKNNKKPIIRLNLFSDIDWRKYSRTIYDDFPQAIFYHYTKIYKLAREWLDGGFPKNVHYTFSRSEKNEDLCWDLLGRGCNVAVVFHPTLPKEYKGYSIINGDKSDLRFLDKKQKIVGLTAKGIKARNDNTGFVVRL